ncbi:MAG TPA: DUF192 domain-containing protein [Patescibacteria group bacterium]|nr:DUF192 domain-containing protein [Patescibacteria group bacterium]
MEALKNLPWRRYGSVAIVIATMIGGFMSSYAMPDEEATVAYSGDLPVEQVTIERQKGGLKALSLEVVSKPVDLAMGLMYRKSMGTDQGMLFQMGKPARPTSFWMKNTLIPLDIIFVAEDGRITHIHPNAKPHDLSPIPSNGPVTGVIELNGGRAAALEIQVGDFVVHPYFSQTPKK